MRNTYVDFYKLIFAVYISIYPAAPPTLKIYRPRQTPNIATCMVEGIFRRLAITFKAALARRQALLMLCRCQTHNFLNSKTKLAITMLSPSLNIDRITSTTRLVNSRTEGSQTEWALVLLTMSAIEAFSIGFSVAAAWTIPMQFMKGHVSTATLYIVPSIAHAIVSNILKVMLLAVAKKYTGVFAEQKLEGTTQIGSYVLDVLTGATGVGGAYVIAHGMEDWPTGNMSIPVIFAIFLIGFFLQPLLKLILSGAWLKITYQIERSSIEVLYEIFYTDSSVESETTSQLVQHSSEDHNNTKTFLLLVLILNKEFKAMLSLRYFLTKYLNVAVAFSIYSPVGAKIAVWWVGRFNNQYPGILSMIQITWFFAEFAVVDALIIQIAKYILPYEAPTHDIATNFFRASNDNILVPDVSEQGSN